MGKKILIMAICACFMIIMLFPIEIKASEVSTNPQIAGAQMGYTVISDELLMAIIEQINSLTTHVAVLHESLSSLFDSLASSPDIDLMNMQARQSAGTQRHITRIEYYNIIRLNLETGLLRQQRDLVSRQIRVARVRIDLGLTTLDDKNAMQNLQDSLTQQINVNDETLRRMKPFLRTRMRSLGESFDYNFSAVRPTASNASSADSLKVALLNSNASLMSLERQLERLDDSKLQTQADNTRYIQSERELIMAQKSLLTKQLELMALNSWAAYVETTLQHYTAQQTRPMLNARLNLLDTMFDIGEISELTWLEQRFEVNRQLHAINTAAVARAIAVADVNLIMSGLAA